MNVFERHEFLKAALAALPTVARVVFAAACAERLLPVWRQYVSRESVEDGFGPMLEQVWLAVAAASPGSTNLDSMYLLAPGMLPEEDCLPPTTQGLVEYSATAVASALGQLLGREPDGAADSALCVWGCPRVGQRGAAW